ncbi:hypothetical protein PMG11_07567 [Penicillium brasilianum]|uniref:Uncharacterized protein n=1 Tax=Penicillium brasilianum TaxID=104259 RepID=A0A0F7TUW1_PENBI|nr:hypothetical protein PMG11_07567 [Penicillium brasilianum]
MFGSRLLAAELGICLLAFLLCSFFDPVSGVPHSVRSPADNPFKHPDDTSSSSSSSSDESDPFSDCNEIEVDTNDISPTNDGPTGDKAAGLGVEFESGINFKSVEDCGEENTFASKGKTVKGHESTNWDLTVDTTSEMTNYLQAEYILNGINIKIGQNQAVPAAKAIASDLETWNPYLKSDNPMTIEIVDPVSAKCKTWQIRNPSKSGDWKAVNWQAQATAPLPMAALDALFKEAKTSTVLTNPLLPGIKSQVSSMVWVNDNFFQSSPQGITEKDVTAEERAFFSLVLSYVKKNPGVTAIKSMKDRSPIMPRTNFVSLYEGVESSLSGKDLYELVRVLVCYKNVNDEGDDGEQVELDTQWCDGTVAKPVPKSNIDSMWTLTVNGKSPFTTFKDTTSFTVKDWMNGLKNSGTTLSAVRKALGTIATDKKEPQGALDLMAFYDRWFDTQIGAYGTVRERIVGNSALSVPLFEFRNLGAYLASAMATQVDKIEQKVIAYHKTYSTSGISASS